jgi:hypothetical protein
MEMHPILQQVSYFILWRSSLDHGERSILQSDKHRYG